MRFVNLKLKNWLSFVELDYNFQNKALQVQGINNTDIGQKSNGAGKSSIHSAIEKCILDTTSRKVKDRDLVNRAFKSSEISLLIECPVRNEKLLIERTLKIKGSSTLKLTLNGEPITFATVRDGNDYIINWIDISKEDIQNCFIVGREKFISFFSSPNSKKIELINRFSNATIVDGVFNSVVADIDLAEEKVDNIKGEISGLEGKVEAFGQVLEREENRNMAEENEKLISSKRNRIESLITQSETDINRNIEFDKAIDLENELIDSLKGDLDAYASTLDEIAQKMAKIDSLDLNKELSLVEEKIKSKSEGLQNEKDSKKELTGYLDEAEDILTEISLNLKGAITCPNCKHEFSLKKEGVDVAVEKKREKETKLIIEDLNKSILNISDKIKNYTKEHIAPLDFESRGISKKIQQVRERQTELQRDLDKVKDSISETESEIKSKERVIIVNNKAIKINETAIEENEAAIANIKAEIAELEKAEIAENPAIKETQVEISKIKKQLSTKQLELSLANDKLHETSKWRENFKKFRLFLAQKSIKTIQGHCNRYLKYMDSDLRVKMEAFKTLADGSLKEEITAYVVRDGEVFDFNSFSGGERGRMEYSMVLALQYMINSTNEYGGLEFLSADEFVEGLDPLGLDNLLKSLGQFEFPIMITTHIQSEKNFENVLTIVKDDGVSQIKENS